MLWLLSLEYVSACASVRRVCEHISVPPPDNNRPNRTDYPRETEPGGKKAKVLPSDNNRPNRTDNPRDIFKCILGEKKERSAFR